MASVGKHNDRETSQSGHNALPVDEIDVSSFGQGITLGIMVDNQDD